MRKVILAIIGGLIWSLGTFLMVYYLDLKYFPISLIGIFFLFTALLIENINLKNKL